MTPLIDARGARTEGSSGTGVTVASTPTARHVVLLAAPEAFFRAVAGLSSLAGGEIRVCGRSPAGAIESRAVAVAPLDPVLMPSAAPAEYVRWSAELAGSPRLEASVTEALERLQLAPVARTPMSKLSLATRRGVVVAAALATGAEAIFLENPFASLAENDARDLARVLSKALDPVAWALFVPRISLGWHITTHADEAILFHGERVVAQGAAEEVAVREGSYSIRTLGAGDRFSRRLEEAGATARFLEGGGDLAPAALLVELGDALTAVDVFRLAEEEGEVILELRPLSDALR